MVVVVVVGMDMVVGGEEGGEGRGLPMGERGEATKVTGVSSPVPERGEGYTQPIAKAAAARKGPLVPAKICVIPLARPSCYDRPSIPPSRTTYPKTPHV